MSSRDHPRQVRRGAYLLPSLFTVGNIFLGFYALVLGLRQNFELAVLLIFAAAFLDGLDGRIARMTGTDSEFGKEYDSLADLITFGVAPALLAHVWDLSSLGRFGVLGPFFYLVCAATRLARFNVQASVIDRRFFVGLPAPAAAGALGSILFFVADRPGNPWLAACLLVALVLIGLLMVSNFRYYSFKELDLRRRWSYRIALPIALLILAVALHPAAFFLAVSTTYAASGPILWVRGRLVRPREAEAGLEAPGEKTS